MVKKILLVLTLSVLTAGMVFSQTDFREMAKNTITVDIGPTIAGAAIAIAGDMLDGFGIGVQYERQLFQKFSVAGRFAYMGGGEGALENYTEQGVTETTSLGIHLLSFSIEGNARYYPWGKTFFLNGMLGYAYMAVKFSGNMVETVEVNGQTKEEAVSINMEASQSFVKLGAKIGWRISFGNNGGFTFEPALGYAFGIGIGDGVADQISKQMKEKSYADIQDNMFNQLLDIFQNYILIGGPRLTLAFGWRF